MSRPWMPLYVSDYLGDTRRLTTLQHGAYLLLIMEYWQHGGLPDDDGELADIAGLELAEWVAMRPRIARLFKDGWRHKRIDEELAKASEISNRRRASAERRWSKSNANALQEEDTCNARAGVPQPQPQSQDNSEIHDHPLGGWSASPQLPEEPSPEPPALRKPKRAKAKTQIDEDAQPSERDRAAADEAGLTPEMFRTEWRKFRDHHRAEGSLKLDWAAAWRYWLGNVQKYQPRAAARAGPHSFPEKRSNVAQAIEELHGEFFGQDWRPSSGNGTGNLIEFNELDYSRSDRKAV